MASRTIQKISNDKLLSFLLLLLFITLPFERILTFDLAGFTIKPPYIAGILLVIYFLYFVVSRKIKVKLESYDYAAIAFILFSYATFFWSIDRIKTLIISSMFLFVYLIFLSVRNFACCHSERSEESQRSFARHTQPSSGSRDDKLKIDPYSIYFIWLGVACSLFALFQFFGDSFGLSQSVTGLSNLYTSSVFGFPRVQSTFFEPGFFANFLLIPIFINMSRLGFKRSYYLSFLIIFVAFLLTLSRGGFFAFMIAYIVAAILIIIKKRNNILIYRSLALMIASALLALLSIWFVSGSQGLSNFSNQTTNAQDLVAGTSQENVQNFTRNATIKIAINNWKKNIFGIGTGAFGSLPEFDRTRELGNQRQTVNSLYPEILVEGGTQSLAAFIIFIGLLIVTFFKTYWKTGDLKVLFFAISILAIFLQYLSFSTLYLIYVWVFLGLAAASINQKDQQLLK